MTKGDCVVCGKGKGVVEISDGRKICQKCEESWHQAQAYEAQRAAEAAEMNKMIQGGLCNYCAKVKYCEMFNSPTIGACRSGDRCTEFVNKKGLKKKEKDRIKEAHGSVPIASEAEKPTNPQSKAPVEDVYSWIVKQDLSDEEQEQVAKLVDEIDDEKQLKKEITKLILRRKANAKKEKN